VMLVSVAFIAGHAGPVRIPLGKDKSCFIGTVAPGMRKSKMVRSVKLHNSSKTKREGEYIKRPRLDPGSMLDSNGSSKTLNEYLNLKCILSD
jgi:hypothetical protein